MILTSVEPVFSLLSNYVFEFDYFILMMNISLLFWELDSVFDAVQPSILIKFSNPDTSQTFCLTVNQYLHSNLQQSSKNNIS